MRASSSSAARQLRERLRGGAGGGGGSESLGRPHAAPRSAGSGGSAARNRAAGARLTPLAGAPAPAPPPTQRTRSQARGPSGIAAARGRPPPAVRGTTPSGEATDFANSTGGVRKPLRPVGSPDGGDAAAASGGGRVALPTRPSVRRAVGPAAAALHGEPKASAADGEGGRSRRETAAPPQERPSPSASAAAAPRASTGAGTTMAAVLSASDAGARRGRDPDGRAGNPPSDAQPVARQLPFSAHDMDFAFYRDPKHWNSGLCTQRAGEACPVVLSRRGGPASIADKINYLLTGKQLEPPYASHLWAQCLRDPATAIADREAVIASRHTASIDRAALSQAAAANTSTKPPPPAAAGSGARERPAVSPLEPTLHAYKHTLEGGYFRCVRCHTPVCAPAYFWKQWHSARATFGSAAAFSEDGDADSDGEDDGAHPPPASTRAPLHQHHHHLGHACFTHVHAKALRVELDVPTSDACGCSSPFQTEEDNSADGAGGLDGDEGGHHFRRAKAGGSRGYSAAPTAMVFCANCDGCLGTVSLHDVSGRGRGTDARRVEVFVANSLCLQYVAEEATRANLRGHLLLDAASDSEDAGGGGGGEEDSHQAARPTAASTSHASGGWMSGQTHLTSSDTAAMLRGGGGSLPLPAAKSRPCLEFRDDELGAEEDGENEAVDEDSRGRGVWAARQANPRRPHSSTGWHGSDLDDADVGAMFDDLDDETLYM